MHIIEATGYYLRLLRIYIIRLMLNIFSSKFQFNDEKKAVIVMPHPDDETFGCSGMISFLIEQKVEVKFVLFTSGEAAHKECCNPPIEQIQYIREELLKNALKIHNLPNCNLHILRYPDGGLPSRYDPDFDCATEKLSLILTEFKPDLIFSPHPFDIMPDHVACSDIVRKVIQNTETLKKSKLIYYCVWFWIFMQLRYTYKINWRRSFYLDITKWSKIKKKSIANYTNKSNIAPCGDLWISKLPVELYNAFNYNKELYFTDIDEKIFEISRKLAKQ